MKDKPAPDLADVLARLSDLEAALQFLRDQLPQFQASLDALSASMRDLQRGQGRAAPEPK